MGEDPGNVSVVEQVECISVAAGREGTPGTGLMVSVRGCVEGPLLGLGIWQDHVEGDLREQGLL